MANYKASDKITTFVTIIGLIKKYAKLNQNNPLTVFHYKAVKAAFRPKPKY